MNADLDVVKVSMDALMSTREKSSRRRDHAKARLLHAFETTGLAYLAFDGESRNLFDEHTKPAFHDSQRFFALPAEQKKSVTAQGLPPGVTRGYLGTAAESGAQKVEWKEAFSWSRNWPAGKEEPNNAFDARNVWPENNASLQASFNALFIFMHTVMLCLSDALTEALGNDLRTMCEAGESISILRAFHYHPNEDRNIDMTGSCAHTDWGFATLVAQEPGSESALQAYVNGKWYDIPPIEGTLVVNCSDFLTALTRGRLHSPLHRVVLTKRERFSFVYFQYPGFDTAMPDLNSVSEKGLSLLKDQTAGGGGLLETDNRSFGEYIAMKWEQVSRA